MYDVQYSFREICVPAGAVLDIPCSYTYPAKDTVKEAFWFIKWTNQKEEFIDLCQSADYKSRAEYLGNKDHDCTLRIKDLRKTDSTPKYRFRFITDADRGKFSGDEVTLHVVGIYLTQIACMYRISDYNVAVQTHTREST